MNRNFRTLYLKEVKAYFNAPTAYVIISVFLAIAGYFFAQPLFLINRSDIKPFIDISPLLFSFLAPAVTMRLFAEEKKSQTIELLMTMPISETEILAAKYLAALTLLAAILLMTLVYPATVVFLGKPDFGALFCAYAGLFFTAAVFAAAGIFASTLTSNQVIAFIIGFLISFSFYLLGKVNIFMPVWLSPVTDYLGTDIHLQNLARGVLDFRDFTYYFSMIFIFLFLSQVRIWGMKYE